jgi:hypothetical protein
MRHDDLLEGLVSNAYAGTTNSLKLESTAIRRGVHIPGC